MAVAPAHRSVPAHTPPPATAMPAGKRSSSESSTFPPPTTCLPRLGAGLLVRPAARVPAAQVRPQGLRVRLSARRAFRRRTSPRPPGPRVARRQHRTRKYPAATRARRSIRGIRRECGRRVAPVRGSHSAAACGRPSVHVWTRSYSPGSRQHADDAADSYLSSVSAVTARGSIRAQMSFRRLGSDPRERLREQRHHVDHNVCPGVRRSRPADIGCGR